MQPTFIFQWKQRHDENTAIYDVVFTGNRELWVITIRKFTLINLI